MRALTVSLPLVLVTVVAAGCDSGTPTSPDVDGLVRQVREAPQCPVGFELREIEEGTPPDGQFTRDGMACFKTIEIEGTVSKTVVLDNFN